MDFFTSKRFVTTALVLLAVLNVVLLGALWWQNFFSRNFRSVEVREYYTRGVQAPPDDVFTPEQRKQFRKLRKENFVKNMPTLKQIVTLKQELIDEAIKTEPDTAKIARIADMIGAEQAKVDRSMAMHFNDLSKLCTPAQRDSLRIFLGKIYTRRFEHGSRWIREIRPAGDPNGPPRIPSPAERPMP
jgi:hypothetical protein